MLVLILMIMSLFVTFSIRNDNSEPEYNPKSAFGYRSGLGIVFGTQLIPFHNNVSVEKHFRNRMKTTDLLLFRPSVPVRASTNPPDALIRTVGK